MSQRKPPLLEDFQDRAVNETEIEFMHDKYMKSSLLPVLKTRKFLHFK